MVRHRCIVCIIWHVVCAEIMEAVMADIYVVIQVAFRNVDAVKILSWSG